eukprot:TRINITY_DN1946_c0_g1_i3.p1 TRINITY_DN1946_c0_g1~~TRINITY_DN1946_c0_g1_i3.p1  ORF type:complete len:495 (-),score=117.29 TRINITY_DN1946_c0_g1_i3:1010-2494(-)
MGNAKSRTTRSNSASSPPPSRFALLKKQPSAADKGQSSQSSRRTIDGIEGIGAEWIPYDISTVLSNEDFNRSLPDLSEYMNTEPVLTTEDTVLEYNLRGILTIPLTLFRMKDYTKILHLDLSENNLFTLPPIMFSLFCNLQELNLSSNQLLLLPVEIKYLSALELLDLSNNQLQALPSELAECHSLQQLKLARNRSLTFPPPDVHHDIKAVMKILKHPSSAKGISHLDAPIPKSISKHTPERLKDMIRGCIFGFAVGDAVGLSTENMTRSQVREVYGENPKFSFASIQRDSHRVRWDLGSWTDETDQALIVLDAITDNYGEVPTELFTRRLHFLLKKGHPELTHNPGEIPSKFMTSVVMHDDFFQTPHQVAWELHQNKAPLAAGNAAMMRAPFIGIGKFWSLDNVLETTRRIVKATHPDERCVAASVVVASAVALMLQGKYNLSSPFDFSNFMKEILARAKEDTKDPACEEEFVKYIEMSDLQDARLDEDTTRG